MIAWTVTLALAASSVSGNVTNGGRPVAEAVVWLEGDTKSKPMPTAKVDQKGLRFVPHISVVTQGTKVDFPNSDTVYHNVFAQFHAKKFDLGLYPKGSSKSVDFDRPGVVSVLCSIHSEMSAYIVVVDTPYFAKTDKSGNFTISNVKPGAYHARAWHESGKTGTKDAKITSDGGKVDLTISR